MGREKQLPFCFYCSLVCICFVYVRVRVFAFVHVAAASAARVSTGENLWPGQVGGEQAEEELTQSLTGCVRVCL